MTSLPAGEDSYSSDYRFYQADYRVELREGTVRLHIFSRFIYDSTGPHDPFLCCAISLGPNLTSGPIPSRVTAAFHPKPSLG